MSGYPPVPTGWTVKSRATAGPFTTAVTYLHPDGHLVHWSSRADRKSAARVAAGRGRSDEGVLWAPRRAWWWMAVLFALGSACFLVAPFPAFLDAVGPRIDALVFAVGSLLFTAAALLQWRETVHVRGTAVIWQPHRIDWWSSTTQLVGTLFFNATTFRALTTMVDSSSYDREVWRPDALGSVCFLVAGVLAYVEVSGGLLRRPPRTIEGFIVAVNLFGSVMFALSALGAYVLPDTTAVANLTVVNAATAAGALAFLVGAVLLLPEGAPAQ